MDNVSLCILDRQLCHRLFRYWQNDSSIYMDMSLFLPFVYDKDAIDRYFDRLQVPTRKVFAIMLDDDPIGELQLKYIDFGKKECTMGIHMQNDAVKGHGYGTQAVRLGLQYAFEVLEMLAVNADVVVKNTRSLHVLEKIGFAFVKRDEDFCYYRYARSN